MKKILLTAMVLAVSGILPLQAQTAIAVSNVINLGRMEFNANIDPSSCLSPACKAWRKAKEAKQKLDDAKPGQKDALQKIFWRAADEYLKAAVEDKNPLHTEKAAELVNSYDYAIELYKYAAGDKEIRTALYKGMIENIVWKNYAIARLPGSGYGLGGADVAIDKTVCPTGGNLYFTVLEWTNEEGIAADQARMIINNKLGREWLNYLNPGTYKVYDTELNQMYLEGIVKEGQYIARNKIPLSVKGDMLYYLGDRRNKPEIRAQRNNGNKRQTPGSIQSAIAPYLLKKR